MVDDDDFSFAPHVIVMVLLCRKTLKGLSYGGVRGVFVESGRTNICVAEFLSGRVKTFLLRAMRFAVA